MKHTILAVDDEAPNLLLIEAYLEGEDYIIKCFSDALTTLDYLRSGAPAEAILLDRMMPGMDGLSFMKTFKTLPQYTYVPVVMQTAAAVPAQIAEGITAGAYYYLTKPYSREVVKAILSRALSDQIIYRKLRDTAAQVSSATSRIESVEFCFRSLGEVQDISLFLASLYAEPQSALLGIREIMLNAVEHGNLGISYDEKTLLLRAGHWEQEVEHRLGLLEHSAKKARVRFHRDQAEHVLTIEDMGVGFDWTRFVEFDASRATDPHGRGISMSRMVSFDDVRYLAPGNKVICRKAV